MSIIPLDQVKDYLGVIHNLDDSKLQKLIDGAEEEALEYLDRPTLPKKGDTVVDECDSNTPPPPNSESIAPSVEAGIFLIIQAGYDSVSVDDMLKIRKAAEIKWRPFRNNLGV